MIVHLKEAFILCGRYCTSHHAWAAHGNPGLEQARYRSHCEERYLTVASDIVASDIVASDIVIVATCGCQLGLIMSRHASFKCKNISILFYAVAISPI